MKPMSYTKLPTSCNSFSQATILLCILAFLRIYVLSSRIPQKANQGSGIRVDVVPFPSRQRQNCTLCYISNICFNRESVILSSNLRSTIQNFAKSSMCGFRNPKSPTLSDKIIQFRDQQAYFEQVDLVDPHLLLLTKESHLQKLNHIPHYAEFILLHAIRSTILIMEQRDKSFKPFLLTPKTKKMQKWFHGFHNIFTAVFNGSQTREIDEGKTLCYRGSVLSKCKGIVPETVPFQKRLTNHLQINTKKWKTKNYLQLAILTRRVHRQIANIEEVENFLPSVFASNSRRISTRCKRLFFENKDFLYQVREMATTDIVIASHGAANTNFMFMEEGTLVIEIIPYGMTSNFRRVCRLAGVRYEQITAFPDNQKVLACAARSNLSTEFYHRWNELHSGHISDMEKFGVEARSCLREQNLKIPLRKLSEAIQKHMTEITKRTKN